MTSRATVLLTVVLAGCGDKVLTEGLDEPFSVHGGQLIEGDLPGEEPLTTEQINDGVRAAPPFANGLTADAQLLRPHLAGITFAGLVSDDAVAVALQFEGLGSGYWVLPAGPADPFVAGFLTWSGVVDFHDVPPGRHRLRAAAIDNDGRSGTQAGTTICIQRPVPDNGNVCDPRLLPPGIVVSLTWNRPVDLDLVVLSPTGDLIDAKTPGSGPLTPPPQPRLDRNAPGAGYLDADSNRACVLDGRQRENVLFMNPLPGRYRVYANLHDSCGESSVQYAVSVHARTLVSEGSDEAPAIFGVVETKRRVGSLVALQANGSRGRGTYVTEFVVGE